MAYEGIENYLKNISNAYAHFALIETSTEFGLIKTTTEAILRNSSSLEGFNETLKIILSTVIDSIWLSITMNEANKKIEAVSNFKTGCKKEAKSSFKSESKFEGSKYPDSLYTGRSEEHLFTSDSVNVNYPKGKAGRHKSNHSYGFSDPYYNIDFVLPTSPKISFPREARKFTLTGSKPVVCKK